MKYAVTGGTGFLGGLLVERLVSEGHEINSIIRTGNSNAHSELINEGANIWTHEYDGTEDSLVSAIEDVDYIIHLAALFTTKKDSENVKNLMKSNIDFSVNLFSAINSFNPEAGVVSASTFSAFNEQGKYAPQSFYAATKHAVEVLAAGFDIKASFLRFSDTYGKNDPRTKIMNLVRDAVKENRDFAFQSPSEQTINLTHSDDVIDALIETVKQIKEEQSPTVKSYDLFYPENEITLGEMASLLNPNEKVKLTFPPLGKITKLPPQVEILSNFKPQRSPKDFLANTIMGVHNK